MIITDVGLLSIGIVIGMIPAYLWGKYGGDEHFKEYKILYELLKYIHHWVLGVIIIVIAILISNTVLLGIGTVIYLDDALFHSFENYFMRKVNDMIAKSKGEDRSLFDIIMEEIEKSNKENENEHMIISVDSK